MEGPDLDSLLELHNLVQLVEDHINLGSCLDDHNLVGRIEAVGMSVSKVVGLVNQNC